ncbi:MAG: hypothetical protein HKN73_02400 [Gemmatimonadetes bacterium]|nr:hypothetical protein [Gemmatimonadota bacterium]
MQSIPLVTGTVAFLAVGAWTTATKIPEIEQDLEARVFEVLSSWGVSFHTIEARGRNVSVTGVPDEHASALTDDAQAVGGVRTLDIRDDLGTDGSWLRIRTVEGEVTLEGAVESEELASRIRREARSAFAGRRLRDDLSVDGARHEPVSWPTRFLPLFTVAGREVAELMLTLDEEALVVGGRTITAAAADSLAAQIFGAAPGLTLRSLLTEATDFPTRLRAALSGPKIAFQPNTTRLVPGSRDVLARIVRAMSVGEEGIVVVSRWQEGDSARRRLAASRADVLLDYLAAQGVDLDRVESRVAEYEGLGAAVSIFPQP